MPLPRRLLMCPPEEFDIIDVKNPHMEGNIGSVDHEAATRQWQEVRDAFQRCGADVDLIDALPGREDMVFCANQTLVGLTADGSRLCLLSHMKHPSRQREVAAFGEWFATAGYEVREPATTCGFEGSGDAIWHPGRALIWGGYGYRTEPEMYEEVAEAFEVPVIRLRLHSDRFYHLDTCLCAIDERTVLLNPASLEPAGVEMVRAVFADVIECPADEANDGMACNAAAMGGRHVVIQKGNATTIAQLRERGFTVHEVDTGEYLKSGGSVFCMKMSVF